MAYTQRSDLATRVRPGVARMSTPRPAPEFWRGRRVAITGGSGFVGRHAAAELARRGAVVVALVRAGSDRSRLPADGVRCEVAPLGDAGAMARAAAGGGLRLPPAGGGERRREAAGAADLGRDGERLRRVNVGGPANAVAAARRAGVRRLVHVSTIAAVGASTTPTPLDETADWNLGGCGVAYVESKRRAEESALAANGGGLEVVVA